MKAIFAGLLTGGALGTILILNIWHLTGILNTLFTFIIVFVFSLIGSFVGQAFNVENRRAKGLDFSHKSD